MSQRRAGEHKRRGRGIAVFFGYARSVRARRLLAAALPPLAIACDHGRIDVKPPSSVAPITEAPLPDKLRAEATAGVTDPALRELLARHWSWWLAEDPV